MSGAEAAGLVLGAIPLVVSALEHYVEGVDTITRWWRYKAELTSLANILYAENARFLLTCERLLRDIVSAHDLELLMADPGGPQWADVELENKLRQRLQFSYAAYSQAVEDMAGAVKEFQTKLKLDLNWQPLKNSGNSFKEEFRAIKFSLSKRRIQEIVDRIQHNNDMLANLTAQNLELEPLRARKGQHTAKSLTNIQSHARNLYSVISRGWTCQCRASHNAHLRLESRLSQPEISRSGHEVESASVNFSVVFTTDSELPGTLPWSWQEAEIRLLDRSKSVQADSIQNLPDTEKAVQPNQITLEPTARSSLSKPFSRASAFFKRAPVSSKKDVKPPPSPSAPRKGVKFDPDLAKPSRNGHNTASRSALDLSQMAQIENLCLAMQKCMKIALHNEYCLGYLTCEGLQALGVYPRQPSTQRLGPQNIVTSLGDLISKTRPLPSRASAGSLHLSRAERLELALTISSSVLQLNGTPWLRQSLTKHDILLLADDGTDSQRRAFVFAAFSATGPTNSFKSKAFLGLPRNETLFALSILLTELCLGQSFESLRSEEDPLDRNGNSNILTDMSTATRSLEDVYREAGNRYGDAVRRCIHCDFNQRNTSLEDDSFRQAVYDGVVVPLQEIVKDFNKEL